MKNVKSSTQTYKQNRKGHLGQRLLSGHIPSHTHTHTRQCALLGLITYSAIKHFVRVVGPEMQRRWNYFASVHSVGVSRVTR